MAPVLRRLALVAVVGAALAQAAGPSASATGRVLRLPAPLPSRSVHLPVLMYHRVGPLSPSLPAITRTLTVAPADFASQMEWIHAHGYHAVTPLQAYMALEYGRPLPPRPVMITFDDGYRDVLWHAAPILHKLHLPATEYVIVGRISGPDPSFLTWPELTRLEGLGVTIGSHTVTHRDLTLLPAAEARAELRDSRRLLERHLGHPVQWLAYPFGGENPAVVSLARQAGYVLGLTTHAGVVQSGQAPLTLDRVEVTDRTGVSGVASLLQG